LPLTNALVDAVTFYPLNKSNRVTIRAVAISAATETFATGGTPPGIVNRWNDAGTYQQQVTGTATNSLDLSPNNWLYLLKSATSLLEVYQPGTAGAWSLWDTWNVTQSGVTWNVVAVDSRTGAKWLAGSGGKVMRYSPLAIFTITGTPNLTALAVIGDKCYVSGGTSIYRIDGSTGTQISTAAGAAAGLPMAARNDGRIVQITTNTTAFQLRVYESDLSVFANYTRSDTGNTWTALSIASAANLVHVGASDGRVRTYSLDASTFTAVLVFTSPGTPGATGYPSATSLLGVSAVLSSKAAMIDAQLTVRSVVQGIVMN
jgi:hypothetical protein